MPTQQQKPSKMGLPPVLTSLTTSVCSPMAAMARIMKNFDSPLNGVNQSAGIPEAVPTVVITDASTKNRMKNGNTRRSENVPVVSDPPFLACQVRKNARYRVMGIMARVRVSLTMVA